MTDLTGPPIPEYSTVTVSGEYNHIAGRYRWHIDRANPKAYIRPDLLMKAMEGEIPHIEVDGDQLDRIVITDDYGQRFVYVLGKYEPLYDAFEMEWPD